MRIVVRLLCGLECDLLWIKLTFVWSSVHQWQKITTHKRCVWQQEGRHDNAKTEKKILELHIAFNKVDEQSADRSWLNIARDEREEKMYRKCNGLADWWMDEALDKRRENAIVCVICRSHLIYWIMIVFGLRFIGYTRFLAFDLFSPNVCVTLVVSSAISMNYKERERWVG